MKQYIVELTDALLKLDVFRNIFGLKVRCKL